MKQITLFILAALCTCLTYAQSDTSRADLEYLFQNLNKANIPYGYLAEWGTDMADREDYNGILSDSNNINSMDMLRMLYADVYSAKINSSATPMPDLDIINNSIDNANGNPVVLLFSKYGEFKPTAVQQGILSYTNGMLFENYPLAIPGESNSPYNIKKVFCAYPKQNTFTNTVSLSYNASFFYTKYQLYNTISSGKFWRRLYNINDNRN